MNRKALFRNRWWMEKENDVHQSIFAACQAMEPDQSARRTDNAIYRNLYGAKWSGSSLYGDDPVVGASNVNGVIATNIIRTAVDVLGANVGRSKPKATFTTTGGTWSAQRRARRLDKFVYGVMHFANFYRTARDVFRDACVVDMGVLKGWVEDGRIHLERVDSDNILVDTADGYDGKPRSMIQRSLKAREWVHSFVDKHHSDKSKDELAAMHAAVDMAAVNSSPSRSMGITSAFGDVVEIVEGWRLPNGPPGKDGKHDGRHVLAVSSLTLVDEPSTFFPFAFCRVFPPFNGFYAQGVAELLTSNQRTLNWILRRISETVRKLSMAHVFLGKGDQLAVETFAGGEKALVVRGANPPQVLAPNAVPPELWRMMEETIRRGLEQVGVSEGAAAATKPAGLSSGQALRDYQDIQSERFVSIHLAYEDFITDAARLVVRLAADAAEREEVLVAFVPRGRSSLEISWDDVSADEDTFTLKVFSTSSLPTTPAARKQYVDELFSSGQIDGAEYRRLLDMPDTDASTDLALAARDAVDGTLEAMLDGDEDDGAEDDYRPPEPFDDLGYAVKRGQLIYHWAKNEGAPEARLSNVRRYIMRAQEMLDAASATGGAAVGDMRAPDAALPTRPAA